MSIKFLPSVAISTIPKPFYFLHLNDLRLWHIAYRIHVGYRIFFVEIAQSPYLKHKQEYRYKYCVFGTIFKKKKKNQFLVNIVSF